MFLKNIKLYPNLFYKIYILLVNHVMYDLGGHGAEYTRMRYNN